MEKLQPHCQSVTIVSWKWCQQQHCGLEIRQVTLLWFKRVNPNYPFSFHDLWLPDIIWNSYIVVDQEGDESNFCKDAPFGLALHWMCNNIVAWNMKVNKIP